MVADSSCDLLSLDGVDFVSVPLTLRTETEEFRDDARLDVDAMVATLRATKGRSYSACPNVADWEKAFGESGDVLAFTITSSLSGSYSAACVAKQGCEERDPSAASASWIRSRRGRRRCCCWKRQPPRSAAAHRLTRCAALWRSCQRHTHLLFSLESMHNLAQNGRISKLAATAAGRARHPRRRTGERGGNARDARQVPRREENAGIFIAGDGAARLQGRQRAHRALRNAAFSLELYTELRRRFPNADVRRYPLRGLCSYYAERGGIMMGFET